MELREKGRNDGLTMGALSRITRVNLETIRYYERIGLLACPPRTTGGHRVYHRGDVGVLVFIRRARELGFSLADTRALLAFRGLQDASCAGVREIAARQLERVQAKLAALRYAESLLEHAIVRCRAMNDSKRCPLIEWLESPSGSPWPLKRIER